MLCLLQLRRFKDNSELWIDSVFPYLLFVLSNTFTQRHSLSLQDLVRILQGWFHSSNFLRLLHRLLVTSICPFVFPSITCFRRQFLRKMWPIQLAFPFLISCRIFLCSLTQVTLRHFSHDRSNCMTLRTVEDTVNWRRKLYIALCGGIVLEEALDLSFDRLLIMMMMMMMIPFSTALQPGVGLGLLQSFRNKKILRGRRSSPTLNPQPRGPGYLS